MDVIYIYIHTSIVIIIIDDILYNTKKTPFLNPLLGILKGLCCDCRIWKQNESIEHNI